MNLPDRRLWTAVALGLASRAALSWAAGARLASSGEFITKAWLGAAALMTVTVAPFSAQAATITPAYTYARASVGIAWGVLDGSSTVQILAAGTSSIEVDVHLTDPNQQASELASGAFVLANISNMAVGLFVSIFSEAAGQALIAEGGPRGRVNTEATAAAGLTNQNDLKALFPDGYGGSAAGVSQSRTCTQPHASSPTFDCGLGYDERNEDTSLTAEVVLQPGEFLTFLFEGSAIGSTITTTEEPAPVPLPAGAALLGLALAGLGAVTRRR